MWALTPTCVAHGLVIYIVDRDGPVLVKPFTRNNPDWIVLTIGNLTF